MAARGQIELSEEQWRRMNENRATALAKRQKKGDGETDWRFGFVPCTSLGWNAAQPISGTHENLSSIAVGDGTPAAATHRLEVVLELCSWSRFTLTGACVGELRCFKQECMVELSRKLSALLVQSDNCPQQVFVLDFENYDCVVNILRKLPNVSVKHVPVSTRMALGKKMEQGRGFSFAGNVVAAEVVEEKLLMLPEKLKRSLLPFQWEGVRYGLSRNGRCLLADDMGVGKSIQAIAIAACYRDEGSILVICPASMRLSWAEELERWLPFLAPMDVHLVFGKKDDFLATHLPKVVVVSYTMLNRLLSTFNSCKWAMVIVDESHNLRTTRRNKECEETTAVTNLVKKSIRAVLLSGTPSLSRPFDIFNQADCLRPGLLGKNKYEFARNYCEVAHVFQQGKSFKDYTKGARLQELNVLLRETIMVRRLKEEVLTQLPPKRRQIIQLNLSKDDVSAARNSVASVRDENSRLQQGACRCGFNETGLCECEDDDGQAAQDAPELQEEDSDEGDYQARSLSYQEVGFAKLRGVRDWLLNHPVLISSDVEVKDKKMVVFGHHRAVLDGIQETIMFKGIGFVRVDGTTPPHDRQKAVDLFQTKSEIKVAIISVTAGGVGLQFSAAQTVVFAELPKSASEMLQAEDRTHRLGQKNAVNVYIFCGKKTRDELQWQSLSKSLERVSTMTNGMSSAVPGLKVSAVKDAEGAILSMQQSQSGNLMVDPNVTEQNVDRSASDGDDSMLACGDASIAVACVSDEIRNAECLMFEVSSNTGRIHLYSSNRHECTPTSLQVNFKPEMLELYKTSHVANEDDLPDCLFNNMAFQGAAMSFITEWNGLRPVHRKQLSGKPLHLPLSKELEYVRASSKFSAGGLLKGGSKRRLTPRDEVCHPAPEGANSRMLTLKKPCGPKQSQILQAWSAGEEPLCKRCQTPCLGKNSRNPEVFADVFCTRKCYDIYSEKTNPSYLRRELFQLERGICVQCGLDCHALVQFLVPLSADKRQALILEKAPKFSQHKTLLDNLVANPSQGHAWHADHIVPVFDGGGECDIENLRTLCVVCHAKVTSDQSRQRHLAQKRARQGLEQTIAELLQRSEAGELPNDKCPNDNEDYELASIEVAGSAYAQKMVSTVETKDGLYCRTECSEMPTVEVHKQHLVVHCT